MVCSSCKKGLLSSPILNQGKRSKATEAKQKSDTGPDLNKSVEEEEEDGEKFKEDLSACQRFPVD